MAKSSFFNKKFIIVVLVLIALVGVGIGAYFIFKPKPDLKLPFNSAYECFYDENVVKTQNFNTNLINYSNAYGSAEIDGYTESINLYNFASQLQTAFDGYETFFVENIIFCSDNNDFINFQNQMQELKTQVINDAKVCAEYIDTYLSNQDMNGYPNNVARIQKLKNYNNFYKTFIKDLMQYYSVIANFMSVNCNSTITLNRLVKAKIYVATKLGYQMCVAYFGSNPILVNGLGDDLIAFSEKTFDSEAYFADRITFDIIIDKVYQVEDEFFASIATGKYQEFLENKENKEQYETTYNFIFN